MIISGKLPGTHNKKTSFFVTSFVPCRKLWRNVKLRDLGVEEGRGDRRQDDTRSFTFRVSYRTELCGGQGRAARQSDETARFCEMLSGRCRVPSTAHRKRTFCCRSQVSSRHRQEHS